MQVTRVTDLHVYIHTQTHMYSPGWSTMRASRVSVACVTASRRHVSVLTVRSVVVRGNLVSDDGGSGGGSGASPRRRRSRRAAATYTGSLPSLSCCYHRRNEPSIYTTTVRCSQLHLEDIPHHQKNFQ